MTLTFRDFVDAIVLLHIAIIGAASVVKAIHWIEKRHTPKLPEPIQSTPAPTMAIAATPPDWQAQQRNIPYLPYAPHAAQQLRNTYTGGLLHSMGGLSGISASTTSSVPAYDIQRDAYVVSSDWFDENKPPMPMIGSGGSIAS